MFIIPLNAPSQCPLSTPRFNRSECFHPSTLSLPLLVRHDNEDTLMDDDDEEPSQKKNSHFDDDNDNDDDETSPTITRGGDPSRLSMDEHDRMKDKGLNKGSDHRARESADSLAGRIEAKQERISFDDETINTSVAAAALTEPTESIATGGNHKSNDNKTSSSNHHRVGDTVIDDRSMYSSSHVDDDSLGGEGIGTGTGTGTLSFAISENASEYNDHNHSIATGEKSLVGNVPCYMQKYIRYETH